MYLLEIDNESYSEKKNPALFWERKGIYFFFPNQRKILKMYKKHSNFAIIRQNEGSINVQCDLKKNQAQFKSAL